MEYTEHRPEKQSPFEMLVEEKAKDGWSYVGQDYLKEVKFIDGKFAEVEVHSEETLREKQRERLTTIATQSGEHHTVEVDLVTKPRETLDGIEIPDRIGTYYVFAKVTT